MKGSFVIGCAAVVVHIVTPRLRVWLWPTGRCCCFGLFDLLTLALLPYCPAVPAVGAYLCRLQETQCKEENVGFLCEVTCAGPYVFYSMGGKPRSFSDIACFSVASFPQQAASESKNGSTNRKAIVRLRKQSVPNSCRAYKVVFKSVFAAVVVIKCLAANLFYLFNF